MISLIKALGFDGQWLDADGVASLHAANSRLRMRGIQQVITHNSTTTHQTDVVACLWPTCCAQAQRMAINKQASTWWGSMQRAWTLVEAWERRSGKSFEQIVFTRPDLQFHSSFGSFREYDARFWHASLDPPDAFWLLPRDVAADALTLLKMVQHCNSQTSCCKRRPGSNFLGTLPALSRRAGGLAGFACYLLCISMRRSPSTERPMATRLYHG